MTDEEFAKLVQDKASNATPFEPTALYDEEGDCIEFLAKSDAFYAKRIDNLVTVYLAEGSNEIIGSLIKGVSEVLRQYPGLKIDIHNGRILLSHLLCAHIWSGETSPEDFKVVTYRELIRVSEEAEAEAQVFAY